MTRFPCPPSLVLVLNKLCELDPTQQTDSRDPKWSTLWPSILIRKAGLTEDVLSRAMDGARVSEEERERLEAYVTSLRKALRLEEKKP